MTLISEPDITLSTTKRLKSTQEVGLELASRDLPIGVDAINLWYPTNRKNGWRADINAPANVDEPLQTADWLSYGSNNGLARLKAEIPISEHGGIEYGFNEHTSRNSTMWLRILPSQTLFGPKSLEVATLDDTKRLIHMALSEMFQVAEPLCNPGEIRISTMDVTRDIHDVALVEEVLSTAEPLLPHSRLDIKIHKSPQLQVSSVTRRTSRGDGACVYNKSRQSGLGNSVVRFEMRLSKKRLSKACPDIQHLTQGTINQLFFDSFDPVAAGLLTVPEDTIREVMLDGSDRKQLCQLIGEEVLRNQGYFVPKTKYAQNARRKFANKHPLINIGRIVSAISDSNYQ